MQVEEAVHASPTSERTQYCSAPTATQRVLSMHCDVLVQGRVQRGAPPTFGGRQRSPGVHSASEAQGATPVDVVQKPDVESQNSSAPVQSASVVHDVVVTVPATQSPDTMSQ